MVRLRGTLAVGFGMPSRLAPSDALQGRVHILVERAALPVQRQQVAHRSRRRPP